ncbi:dopamine receptor 2-like [Acropora millepora]|uniref:dopamine receptor 2-like n=1 Tax=Acropora millepora TaxID=45264 RepID=UPI001CF0E506|nr:dopamine receptor 2-like [Acropora millepora]XP_029195105.2 dopamine receptor 2-like [Acropora millepora]XP_029195106.2 dopamine receptor 2-like [Acropora millepora]XP_029195107.2 dopamine receptor 2-like [Acropora millepora]
MAVSNSTAMLPTDIDGVCQQATKPEFIVYSVFLVLIMLATLFGNVLVITAVYHFHRLRRMTNFFIISLAVSDLLVALGHLPLRIDQSVHNNNWCFDKTPNDVTTCAYWIVMDTVFSCASICNLVVISIDRFLAITKPFEYQNRMTKRVGFSLIAFVWVYALLWGVLSLVDWTRGDPNATDRHIFVIVKNQTNERACGKNDKVYYTTAMAVALFLPLLIVIATYACVFRVAFTQAKAVALLDPTKGKRHILRELKATKTIAVVIGVFIVCWLPGFILIVLSFWCQDCFKPLLDNKNLSLSIRIIFVFILPVINSSLNPVIYTVFNQEFRMAFSRMLCRGRTPRSAADVEFSVTEQTACATRVKVQTTGKSRPKAWFNMNGRGDASR